MPSTSTRRPIRSSERPSHRPAVASRLVCWSRYRSAAARFTGGPGGGGSGPDRGREVLRAVAGEVGPVAGAVGEVTGPVLGQLGGADQLGPGGDGGIGGPVASDDGGLAGQRLGCL